MRRWKGVENVSTISGRRKTETICVIFASSKAALFDNAKRLERETWRKKWGLVSRQLLSYSRGKQKLGALKGGFDICKGKGIRKEIKKEAKEIIFRFINEPGYVDFFSWNTIKRHDRPANEFRAVR